MKVGVLTALFSQKSLGDTLDYVQKTGLEAVEIGTGNYLGDAHCKMDELLNSKEALKRFGEEFKKRNIEISALSCHGNPLHPEESIAKNHREITRKTFVLANRLGIERVTLFSGCPGDSDSSKYPNWVTCPWPEDYSKILKWQWEEKVIPYWQEEVKFAQEEGIEKICIEMHPGFVVYNPETLLKLREAAGRAIGANFDPSHLFWQGIDPIAAARKLKDCIYHVHAKDTKIDDYNTSVNGVLDTKSYRDEMNRSWIFRTVGYGHAASFWKDFISTLHLCGYDYVLSIEHEDSLMSVNEGFQKAVSFLEEIILKEKRGEMWWA